MAFREYVRLMLRHWWQLGVAALCAIIGLMMDMDIISIPLPSWVWWAVALGSFIVAQYLSFATLHGKVVKYRSKPKPSEPLEEVHTNVYLSLPNFEELSDPEGAAVNAIIEQAVLGSLQIFGTRTNPKDGDGAMLPIDKGFWKENSFEFPFSTDLSPKEERKISHTTGASGDVYYNLQVDPDQVSLCWPQQKKFKFRMPFVWETT